MSVGETPITIVGNLTDDPEMRYLPTGDALARFTVASTPRSYDKTSGQWKDGTGMFLRCTAWRELAENTATSLSKGARVVVTGRLRQHDWTTDAGEKRSLLGLEVDDIGPSLRWATARIERTGRRPATPPAADPWADASPQRPSVAQDSSPQPSVGNPVPVPGPVGAEAGSGYRDEPPF
jgi:single-strand DNA-binding protein